MLADLAELPEKPDEDIYLFELEGLRVLLPDDTPLGVVERVEDDPTEVWTIRTGEGAEVLFPAAEEFILEASPEEGFVRIDPPEGLLEIYLGGE
ncbi:ribosome maturation factor RimM [Desulfohalovibrio reitneri]|uniref:ribosome maturation factor RimM n=1 Tax=Desulfohalovibrio reitneri TaxID=1307759 RepID=UPI00068F9C85|nr:hypothetical protein [Desulfohalovibrio reitneri]